MIVTMATEEYVPYLHIMLTSLFKFNNTQAMVYLINCKSYVGMKLKNEFGNKIHISHCVGDFSNKERYNPNNIKKKVTFLKGWFIRNAVSKFNTNVLWVDATTLIRDEITHLLDILDNKDNVLIYRGGEKKKFSFAAGLFGMSKNNLDLIYKYDDACTAKKITWYADQLSLNEIVSDKTYFISLEKYCNFNYSRQAKCWADRGRTGVGVLTAEDNYFTINKFINELNKHVKSYKTKHYQFLKQLHDKDDRKKILVFTDDDNWCYNSTVSSLIDSNNLKDEFLFTVINNVDTQINTVKYWQGDLVWCRCDSRRAQKLYEVRPDLKKMSFSSITTGGDLLKNRVDVNIKFHDGEAGLIVQNDESEYILKNYKVKNIIKLPNGVDVDKFEFNESLPDKFTIGFAGRTLKVNENKQKGFDDYVIPVVTYRKFKMITADNGYNKLSHADMPAFYKKISVLLLPSYAEGCSNTIFEAMASGVPVITTRTGWHYENCTDYENILFCDRNLLDIDEKIMLLNNNKELYNKIRHNARKFAEKHSWNEKSFYYKQQLNKMLELVKNK